MFTLHQQVEDSQTFRIAQGAKSGRDEFEGVSGQYRMLAGLLGHGSRVLTESEYVNIQISECRNQEKNVGL